MSRLFGTRWDRRTGERLLRRAEHGPGPIRVALWFVLATLVLGAITFSCYRVLDQAVAGEGLGIGTWPLYGAAGLFLVTAFVIVVVQSFRVAQRIAGPEYRLIQTLRRIRAGDVSFRVHLRRSDLLHGLAEECNALLDWLNTNPPAGARTGTDVYEIGALEPEFTEHQT